MKTSLSRTLPLPLSLCLSLSLSLSLSLTHTHTHTDLLNSKFVEKVKEATKKNSYFVLPDWKAKPVSEWVSESKPVSE